MKLKLKMMLRQFLLAAVALLIISYFILQLVLSVGDIVTVQAAEYTVVTDTLDLSGCIFRDETPLYSGSTGTVCYLADDYEKVMAGQAVASIYATADDAGIQTSIKALKDKILLLEKSAASASTTDLSFLDTNINSLIINSVRSVEKGLVTSAAQNRDELLIYLNRRSSVVSGDSYEIQIKTLENEILRLESSILGAKTTVTSPSASWFVSFTDGYETYFTLNALENMTIESYKALLEQSANDSLKTAAIGKLYNDSLWYLVVCTDKRTAIEYKVGKNYNITFPYSLNQSVEMTYERYISQTNTDEIIMIFSTRTNYDGFNFLRYQPVEIAYKSYSGLKVPRSAVRVKDGMQGVYVLDGNVIIFKTINILYEQANYYICAVPDGGNITAISDTQLSLYDLIITEGKQIYEGRVLS